MLVEHVGWKLLMEIAEGQIANRMPKAMEPLENILNIGLKEREQGTIDGIKLFQLLPEKRIADIKETLEELQEDIDDERASQPTSPAAGGESREPGDEFEPAAP